MAETLDGGDTTVREPDGKCGLYFPFADTNTRWVLPEYGEWVVSVVSHKSSQRRIQWWQAQHNSGLFGRPFNFGACQ